MAHDVIPNLVDVTMREAYRELQACGSVPAAASIRAVQLRSFLVQRRSAQRQVNPYPNNSKLARLALY